jgi:small multidrug resistance pump
MIKTYLFIAIVSEVVATLALKSSDGFSRLLPGVVVVAGYGLSMFLLSVVLTSMDMGVAYAIWSGLGIVLVTIAGMTMYNQQPDAAALVGMGLIVAGVGVIQLFSKMAGH